MMIVYKVTSDGTWCALKTIDQAVEMVAIEMEAALDSMEPGDETPSFKIVVDEMTEEEFENLPEFDGF
ncbi:hypothetical protein [Sporomusa paucivorans]|uniref:hypothetical protein n=1 Tax=Sporomusa paucivorans TaxID=2376 RepID=UPI003570B477